MEPSGGILIIRKELLSVSILNFELVSKKPVGIISFFIPFIIITSFAVLNFFIGIIVDSMQIAQKDDQSYKEHENSQITMKEYKLLKKQLDELVTEISLKTRRILSARKTVSAPLVGKQAMITIKRSKIFQPE